MHAVVQREPVRRLGRNYLPLPSNHSSKVASAKQLQYFRFVDPCNLIG